MSRYNLDDSPENWALSPRRLSPNFTLSNGEAKAYPIRLEHYEPGSGQSPQILDFDLAGLRRLIGLLETARHQISIGDTLVYATSPALRNPSATDTDHHLSANRTLILRSSGAPGKTSPETLELEIAFGLAGKAVITFAAWEIAGLAGGLDAYRQDADVLEEEKDARQRARRRYRADIYKSLEARRESARQGVEERRRATEEEVRRQADARAQALDLEQERIRRKAGQAVTRP